MYRNPTKFLGTFIHITARMGRLPSFFGRAAHPGVSGRATWRLDGIQCGCIGLHVHGRAANAHRLSVSDNDLNLSITKNSKGS